MQSACYKNMLNYHTKQKGAYTFYSLCKQQRLVDVHCVGKYRKFFPYIEHVLVISKNVSFSTFVQKSRSWSNW